MKSQSTNILLMIKTLSDVETSLKLLFDFKFI